MKSRIKPSAIPASGYMYQTLVGIRMLCDWLDHPELYAWVQFEADERDARGLDDVIVQLSDGRLGLTQVKFTVDPFDPSNALSWRWLLHRKGAKGRSLLEKWSGAAFDMGLERLAELQLISNRRPDYEFARHLNDGKVDLATLPDELVKEVHTHLGGASNAARFFAKFEFRHSYQGYRSLEANVIAALEERHTDHAGWLMLWSRALDWSIHRDSPGPNGRITLDVLRQTISERQPRPLDQEFRVPNGYLPSDPDFADTFIDAAESGQWDMRILWGSPGQGKSTFLSYVCKRLKERGLPFVRHHYFLDLQDGSDRFSLKTVAHSLVTQAQANEAETMPSLSSHPDDLRQSLAACSRWHAKQGKRFFVLIDGLDHLWRENDEDIAPMKALFAKLLPLPPNMTLILGTQRVDKSQLPARLNDYLAPEHWVELPRMRLPSVRAWLEALYNTEAFRIEADEPVSNELAELALAFRAMSDGHPLVLTYTFLALTRNHPTLTPSLVKESTPAPFGDARAYYSSLWQRLSWNAKDALYLMADEKFIWPAGALERCLATADFRLEAEIGHLLAPVDAGLVAFHGSLYVFILGQNDYTPRIQSLLPSVEAWLTHEAPQYLRWAWLWLVQSRRGENSALLAETTRSWAIEALARAYPSHQICRILQAAEEVAFSSGNYEDAIRKRALKNRIENGLSYQLDDASLLEDIALRLTPDPYPVLLLASEIGQSSIAGLHQLAMLYLSLDQKDRAAEVQERMRHKINDRISSRTLKAQDYDEILELYLDVAAGTSRYEPRHVVRRLRRHRHAEEAFGRFLNRVSRASDIAPLMAFSQTPMPARLRKVLEIETLRTAAWVQAGVHEWTEFDRFTKHPLSSCWRHLYASGSERAISERVPAHELADFDLIDDDADFASRLHSAFFGALRLALRVGGERDPGLFAMRSKRKWLGTALNELGELAWTCATLLKRGESPPFSLAYRLVALDRPALNDHNAWSDFRSVRKGLVLITADLFFLTRPHSHLAHVPADEWKRCSSSALFALDHWREIFLTQDYRILDDDLVSSHIEELEANTQASIEPFNEKSRELADLCSWATAYGLDNLANRLLSAAYRCGIGYGWRKDWGLPRLLHAVEEVAEHDPEAATYAVRQLASIYTNLDKMTEGSGANQSDLAPLIINLMPQIYPRYYRFWLERSEWYEAEKTFAAFANHVASESPEAQVAMALLRGTETPQHVISEDGLQKTNASQSLLVSRTKLRQDERSYSISDESQESVHEPEPTKFEDYPPDQLAAFLASLRAMRSHEREHELIVRWFRHWEAKGRGGDLLTALEIALTRTLSTTSGTQLLDLAFPLSLRLQGPSKAFRWLVEAHRHRYGWSEHYHGQEEASERIALVAQHYRKRWPEFVTSSSLPVSRGLVRTRAIPDAPLISLLLQVGEVGRAVSVLRTMVDVTLEEFEMQPLSEPLWLTGATQ